MLQKIIFHCRRLPFENRPNPTTCQNAESMRAAFRYRVKTQEMQNQADTEVTALDTRSADAQGALASGKRKGGK